MKLSIFFVAALIGAEVEALQTAFSRRSFVGKFATVSAGAVVAIPSIANAEEEVRQRRKKQLRGGKEVLDATHNGTELNAKEADVAGGLLSKMGVTDIAPDKDSKGATKK
jgi:hypothetical protein